MYIFTLSLFLPLFHLFPSFCLPPKTSKNIHLCKSVNLVFSPHFKKGKKKKKKVKYCIYSGVSELLSLAVDPWRSEIYSQDEKSNCCSFFQPFSLLLYDFKTELKIKWLVNLLGFFFQCTLFLLWMNSSFSISPPSWLHSIHHFCPHIFDTFTKAKKIKKFKKNSRWIYCRYFSKYELFFRRVWLLRWWTVKRERKKKKDEFFV